MPQGPTLALVAKQGKAWSTLELDPESNLYTVGTQSSGGGSGAAASTTTLNITVPVVVKLGSGRLVTISLLGPGSIIINDASTLTNATIDTTIVNLSTTSGWLFHIDLPVANGIVVSAISGQAVVSYQ